MSVHKIDFGGPTWSAHNQDHWLDMAGRTMFPDYLRVLFVAYGRHRANGHAKLERGELAYYLVRQNGSLPDRRVIRDAVQRAVVEGYLMPESRLLCLVVPGEHVQGGEGKPTDRCVRDHTRRKQNDRQISGRFDANDRHQHSPSRANDRQISGRSTLTPSISSSPARASVPDASASDASQGARIA